jgi:transcriptional regulator with GAF, ATPase, and Fis domain
MIPDGFLMAAIHALPRVLSALESEFWDRTRASAVGLVMPASDGLLRFEQRNRVMASAIFVHAADLPDVLRLPIDGPRQLAPLAGHLHAGTAVARFMTVFSLQSLCAVPLAGGGLLFAAYDTPTRVDSLDLDALEHFASRLALAPDEEPVDERDRRLTRLDALSDLLPVLGTALDVREIFDRVSAVARRVLPHDFAVIGLHVDGGRRVRLHALSNLPDLDMPEIIDNPYPDAFDAGWGYAIHRHLLDHPFERTRETVRLGVRSSIRVPIRENGRAAGVLNLSSFQPDAFDDADLPIAERLGDVVTLALSHQRLAEEAQHAEKLRERTASVEMLEQLLETLAGVLDIREVFDRVSTIAQKVLPHDAMSIPIILDNPPRLRVHALSGFGDLPESFESPMPEPRLLTEPWDHIRMNFDDTTLYQSSPAVKLGMRSVLCLPIRLEGRLHASLNVYSRRRDAFTPEDVLVGHRITDHITLAFSHHRLAEEAKRAAELSAGAASLEMLDELLAAETHEGELDEIVDRVSAIAQKVLPHDAMVLPIAMPDGRHARVHARGGGPDAHAFPEVVEIPDTIAAQNAWEYDLIDDLQAHPVQRFMSAAQRGYRSVLRVPVRLEDRYAGALVFFASERGRYTQSDVMVARRIADRVTLVLARDRGAAAARRAEEATARAAKLEARVRALTDELDARTGARRVVGESPTWRQVLLQATRVAATDTTVLLLGESGTGKEVVARFIHRASGRTGGPFVALNCAALPEHLLESELFGFERGAFTGATQAKPGQLEQAAGGTLFLDEVGEMMLPAQAKFLRVLQEREFQRLGGTRVIRSDARIIAATNRDLEKRIAQNAFREDLFYRLNVFAIHLPPLRERRDDILPLSDAFLAEIGRGLGRPPAGIARDARAMLVDYQWPGNVRELRNILERAAILCDGGLITADHLALTASPRNRASAPSPPPVDLAPPPIRVTAPPPQTPAPSPSSGRDLASMERAMIAQALEGARFNKSRAAKSLGLTRAQLYVRMRRHGLE